MLALELWLFLWLLLMRRATLRQGEPRQARQANQGIDSQMELDIAVMSAWVRQSLTTGCGTGCIQSVNGPRGKPVRGGDFGTSGTFGTSLRSGNDVPGQQSLRQTCDCTLVTCRIDRLGIHHPSRLLSQPPEFRGSVDSMGVHGLVRPRSQFKRLRSRQLAQWQKFRTSRIHAP